MQVREQTNKRRQEIAESLTTYGSTTRDKATNDTSSSSLIKATSDNNSAQTIASASETTSSEE